MAITPPSESSGRAHELAVGLRLVEGHVLVLDLQEREPGGHLQYYSPRDGDPQHFAEDRQDVVHGLGTQVLEIQLQFLDVRIGDLLDVFTEIDDPRVARTRAHPLVNILTMSLFGALAGADGWEALEDYAEVQEEFLRCGIPVALSNF